MTPWDLIVWALAAAAGLLIILIPLALVAAAVTMARGKL